MYKVKVTRREILNHCPIFIKISGMIPCIKFCWGEGGIDTKTGMLSDTKI